MTGPSLAELDECHRALLERSLDEFFHDQIRYWSAINPIMGEAASALQGVVQSGGKRLRPLLCYIAFASTGSGDPKEVISACAALELLHTFALLEDDIMDGSTLRRGAPALHVTYADVHARRGLRGDSSKFGESVSFLVADLAFIYSDQLMRGYRADARAVFDQLRVEVVMGQLLDVFSGAEMVPDECLARLVNCYKTEKYTVERPIHLGAVISDAPKSFLSHASRFALPLGLAFQLRDDILGAFGDAEVTGKPVGEDFRQGKQTLLWTYAMRSARPSERDVLWMCGDDHLEASDVARIRDVLVSTGALKRVEEELEQLLMEAESALDSIPMEGWAINALRDLAYSLVYRDS